MSFVPDKEDFSASRLAASLPYFLILWSGIIVLIVCFTLFVKVRLKDNELRDAEMRLSNYLAENPVSIFGFGISRQKGGAGALQGLAFIRLVRHGEQILLEEHGSDEVDFQQLAGLDPGVSGAWISLQDPKKPGPWTIVTKAAASGVSIQAGMVTDVNRLLYARIVRLSWISALVGGGLSLLMALLCVRNSVLPIKKITRDIDGFMSERRTSVFQPADRTGKDLVRLYDRINRLLVQNRQLIAEMQASLDNVAHDLRTPMTRLRAVAEYGLQAGVENPERLRDALSDCLEESERVLSMLKIMMSVAEAESGTMHLTRETVDLNESLTDVISLYEYVAEEKSITVRSDLQPGLFIDADPTRIAQVWANLLDNSIKYGREGGSATIVSRREDGAVVVSFIDDGIGISKIEMPRIWERLYRGDRSRSQPGLGLGLNYVRAVVEAHEGTVHVESELHKGTTFRVRLQDGLSEQRSAGERE